jgi:hypothetical protein
MVRRVPLVTPNLEASDMELEGSFPGARAAHYPRRQPTRGKRDSYGLNIHLNIKVFMARCGGGARRNHRPTKAPSFLGAHEGAMSPGPRPIPRKLHEPRQAGHARYGCTEGGHLRSAMSHSAKALLRL